MEIADSEDLRGTGEVGTDFRPDLRPAVISGAEKQEDVRLHVRVLEAEVSLVDASALGEPGFELAGGFDDVHAGNDSGGEKGKSNTVKDLYHREHRGTEGKRMMIGITQRDGSQ